MDAEEFDVGSAAAPDKIQALNSLLQDAVSMEEAVAQMEEDLKAAKRTLHALTAKRIPDLMDEIGLDSVTFSGWQVKVQDFVSGSLPKEADKRASALDWLKDAGAGGLIRTEISLAFGPAEHDAALELRRRLVSNGYDPEMDVGVNSQSLCAFARERIRNGEPVDADLLGLYVGKVAKLKRLARKGGADAEA